MQRYNFFCCMKVIEILNFNRELLKRLQAAGIRLEIAKINRERRNSKNYVLFLGETGAESNQAPCLSLVQFQLDGGELVLSAYQRSSDANLGLPSDIYHLYLMARQIELPLKSITLYLGNVHIYENNIPGTRALIAGDETVRFGLNV